jgi:hypothetical protein
MLRTLSRQTAIILVLLPVTVFSARAEEPPVYCATSEYLAVAADSRSGVHLWVVPLPTNENDVPLVHRTDLQQLPTDLACDADRVYLRSDADVKFATLKGPGLLLAGQFPDSPNRRPRRGAQMKAGKIYVLPRPAFAIALMRARNTAVDAPVEITALFFLSSTRETLLTTIQRVTLRVD